MANKDADAWLKARKKGGCWRKGRKKYKRGERSGTSGSKHRKVLSEEEKAARKAKKAEEKRLREKHLAWRCVFHKIMSAKTPHGDTTNDNVFEDRVVMMRDLCCQNANVASAALRTEPPVIEQRGEFLERTCDVFVVLHAKRAVADIKKEFAPSRIRLAAWESADPKAWKDIGLDYQVVRDATPASKTDAKLLMAALTGEEPKSRKRKPPGEAQSMEELLAEPPSIKLQKLSSGRIATRLVTRPGQIQPSRSGKRRF